MLITNKVLLVGRDNCIKSLNFYFISHIYTVSYSASFIFEQPKAFIFEQFETHIHSDIVQALSSLKKTFIFDSLILVMVK